MAYIRKSRPDKRQSRPEYGTNKTVTAGSWPWLSGNSPSADTERPGGIKERRLEVRIARRLWSEFPTYNQNYNSMKQPCPKDNVQ